MMVVKNYRIYKATLAGIEKKFNIKRNPLICDRGERGGEIMWKYLHVDGTRVGNG